MSTKTRKVTNSPQYANKVRRQIDAWLDQYDGEFTHFVTVTLDAKRIDAYINGCEKKRDRNDPKMVAMYQRSMKHFLSRLQKSVTMRWTPHHRPVSAGTGRVHRNFTNMGSGKDEHLDRRY